MLWTRDRIEESLRATMRLRPDTADVWDVSDSIPAELHSWHRSNGRGVGASHQTGWSGLVALLLQSRLMKLSHVAPDAASPSMVEGSVLSEMPSLADALRQ